MRVAKRRAVPDARAISVNCPFDTSTLNAQGAQVRLIDVDGAQFDLGTFVKFRVLRQNESGFWLQMFAFGYDTAPQQYVHLVKVEAVELVVNALKLHDDSGRQFWLSPVEGDSVWALWVEYRTKHAEVLAEIDDAMFQEDLVRANAWPWAE